MNTVIFYRYSLLPFSILLFLDILCAIDIKRYFSFSHDTLPLCQSYTYLALDKCFPPVRENGLFHQPIFFHQGNLSVVYHGTS